MWCRLCHTIFGCASSCGWKEFEIKSSTQQCHGINTTKPKAPQATQVEHHYTSLAIGSIPVLCTVYLRTRPSVIYVLLLYYRMLEKDECGLCCCVALCCATAQPWQYRRYVCYSTKWEELLLLSVAHTCIACLCRL